MLLVCAMLVATSGGIGREGSNLEGVSPGKAIPVVNVAVDSGRRIAGRDVKTSLSSRRTLQGGCVRLRWRI